MANAARVHAVERGKVVGQYTLIAFGGARAAACGARRREARRRARDRAARMPASARPSASWRRPIAYELVRSRYMRLDDFDAAAVTELLEEMSDGGARAGGAGRARGATVASAVPPSCAMSARATRSRSTLPNRRADGGGCATGLRRSSSATTRRCSSARSPSAAIEILSWSVLGLDRGARSRRRSRPLPRSAAGKPAGEPPRVRRPRGRGDRGAASIAARTWRRARPLPGPP